ncbi:hypothetical protein [Streptomyces glaucescens]|jgi:ATP-dependent DNA ligase|uniref:hypothetical protein n=1 Tax=Streptomyces glaucescens TaxID=1907 RepID=UPI00117E3732|nr:hypothetical protein [Streptomyces glaucescens]
MVLRSPVEPLLAQARDMVPAPGALPGELRFQPKFDGYRALVFTLWSAPGPLLVQSRRGSLMQSRFPELVDAAADTLRDGKPARFLELQLDVILKRAHGPVTRSGARAA